MIGVIADPAQKDVVREFFELFKTPWEFYRSDERYDVVLCTTAHECDARAKLVILYGGGKTHFDETQNVQFGHEQKSSTILYRADRIPIYGDTIRFPEEATRFVIEEQSRQTVAYLRQSGNATVARIGYDLFTEIRTLLTAGQPLSNAHIPTLELHIALLRDLVTGFGIALAEIPPIPEGHPFMVCLTHDVDHPSVRQHKWNRTAFGFCYRAVFGSLWRCVQKRMSFRDLLKNWAAVLKLPLIYLGLAKDFWQDFGDLYLALERNLRSTFFVIPFKGYSGQTHQGPAPTLRASGYAARDIVTTIQKLTAAGCEVGLHGIDAWFDGTEAREEIEEIERLASMSGIGVRMHWLYSDQQSARTLETAGAAYDSTVGYNETVGYRAGTTQVYKPLEVTTMLELPLHVMDTALFYPDRLGLSPKEAGKILSRMAEDAARFGGCLTVNWHDRSLAPERLWADSYRKLLQDLKDRGAWICTAGEAVSWFRKRRSAVFSFTSGTPGGVQAEAAVVEQDQLPGLRLRIHNPGKLSELGSDKSRGYSDLTVNKSVESAMHSEAAR